MRLQLFYLRHTDAERKIEVKAETNILRAEHSDFKMPLSEAG
jgi:hypothetical protein